MNLYAVTYCDPSEPWGEAIYDRKLYHTPGEVLTAFNEAYDRFVEGADYYRKNFDKYMRQYYPTVDHYIEAEFSQEYGVGMYVLVEE